MNTYCLSMWRRKKFERDWRHPSAEEHLSCEEHSKMCTKYKSQKSPPDGANAWQHWYQTSCRRYAACNSSGYEMPRILAMGHLAKNLAKEMPAGHSWGHSMPSGNSRGLRVTLLCILSIGTCIAIADLRTAEAETAERG